MTKVIFFDMGYTLVNEDAVWIKQGFGVLQTPLSDEDKPDYIISGLLELPGIFLSELSKEIF